ncbi:transporter, auxin efflux carrier family protein [Peptostreptococcus anaerobius]|nr:transporter, auxin efflux carrier family protein [Peptostreptococcus anaerobius VPI 4330 = DSM 2949]KXB72630.1 transporter, auxin efflux carrier family protein [Peptostreptococcus anaerobius]KXI14177.1 transporter, auxin efflux carrier family protein [Peptostreptococcus anaerobius]
MLLFLGFIMGTKKIVAHSSINDITNILIDVSIPCTIVVSLIRPFSQRLIGDTIKVCLCILIFHLVMTGISYGLSKILKVDKLKQGSWIFALVFSNNAFIGYPLMYALYGNDGLFLMAMGNIVQNILIFSIGVKMTNLNYGKDEHVRLRNIIITKQNIAVVIGLIIFFTQIAIPKPIVTLITYVSNLTVPLSMIVVGLSLSRYDVRNMFTDGEVYRLTAIRMVIIPIIMLLAYKGLGINANKDLPLAILYFTAVLPAPAFTTIMAERYNTSIEFSSKCVFITTIISIITVPVLAGML